MQHSDGALAFIDPELDAALAAVRKGDEARAEEGRLQLVCAADVTPERVRWLWDSWLPFGKLVAIDGMAGIGKSTAATDLIARFTRGGPMPGTDERFEPGTVLIAGVEDGWADTVRPRLDAAAADLSRVHFVTLRKSGGTFTVPRDVVELSEHVKSVGAQWVHLDAIMGSLDENVNAYSDHEIRRALGPLKDQAGELGFLATFIRHPKKAGGLAVHAGGGSVAFSALSRVQLFIGLHPADKNKPDAEKRRVLAVGKSNLAKHPAALAFTIEDTPGMRVGHIAWQGPVDVTADELASPPSPVKEPAAARSKESARANEKAWLQNQLADGVRVPSDELKARARAAELEWHRVTRAATDIGVSKERVQTFPAHTVWYLPTLQSVQSEHVALGEEPSVLSASSAPTATVKNGELLP